jgi:SAM-dependent methyltransferase
MVANLSENINDDFFKGAYKDVWREIIPKALTEAETDLILELGNLKEGSQVLDVLCGYGRHSLDLARKGVSVTAIDNLVDYIDEINQIAATEAIPIKGVLTDVKSFSTETSFDMCLFMGNSVSFFERETLTQLFKNVFHALKQEGILLINTWMVAEIAFKNFRQHDWHFAGGYKCILENKLFFSPTRIEFKQTIIDQNGQLEEKDGIDFIYSLSEMETILKSVGFNILNLFSTPRKRKFTFGDNQIYLVVSKST